LRVRKKGFHVLYCPQSIIWHHNAGSSGGSGSALHTYYQTRNRVFIGLRHGSLRVKLTSLSYAFRTLLGGNPIEKKAVSHVLTGKMGKQPYDKI